MAIFGMFVVFVFLAGATLYFLPTLIAFARGKRDRLGIFVLNFLLGWSLVGWIVSLVWAMSQDPEPMYVQQSNWRHVPMHHAPPAQPQQGVYLPPETPPPAVIPPREGV